MCCLPQALAFFLKAEEGLYEHKHLYLVSLFYTTLTFQCLDLVDPNFYSKNLLMLGKTFMMLRDEERAALWLTKARDYPAVTEEDKQVHKHSLIRFIRYIICRGVIFSFDPVQVHKEALELLKKLNR